MRARSPRQDRGVTLVELLVVVGIMLAVASIALAAVGQFMGARGVDSAVRRLRGAVRIARAHASSTGKPTNVVFHLGEGRVTVQTPAGEQVQEPIFLPRAAQFAPGFVNPDSGEKLWIHVDGEPLRTLTLRPSGRVELPPGMTRNFWIVVSNRNGENMKGVQVVWTSGLTSQQDL